MPTPGESCGGRKIKEAPMPARLAGTICPKPKCNGKLIALATNADNEKYKCTKCGKTWIIRTHN